MKDRKLKTSRIAIFAIVLAVLAGVAAAEYRYIAAGNKEALWLVRVDTDAGKFDLLARPAGKKWRWVTDNMTGDPAVAATVGSRVMLLMPDPQGYLSFHVSSDSPSQGPPAADIAHWPHGAAPLAACQANGYAGTEMLALVAGSGGEVGGTTTKPATGPTITNTKKADRIATLSLFGNTEKQWTYLAEIKNVRIAEGAAVFLAATGDAAYVLITDETLSKLTVIRKDMRQEFATPSGAKPIGMITSKTGVIVVCQSTDESKAGQLSLATFENGKFTLKQIKEDKKPFVPAETPIIAQLGSRIAMLWKDGDKLMLATCERTGAVNLQETVGILDRPAADTSGEGIIEIFCWGILAVTFISILAVRRRSPPKPFTLPTGMMPGGLLKRLVAGIIDLIPFSIIAVAIFSPIPADRQPKTLEEVRQLVEEFGQSAPAAYSAITGLISYTIYCILMEWRFGATIGKRLMKLRVVGDGGKSVAPVNIVMRNVFRIFELIMPPLPLVLLLVPLLTRNRQRLGDILARTTVVDATVVVYPPPTRQEETEDPDNRNDGDF